MQSIVKRTILLSTTAAIAVTFTGCGESKVAQCNKIIKVANQAVTLSQEFSKNSQRDTGSKTFTEIADKLGNLANEMKALEIKDEKLKGFQGRFIKLYQDTSKGFRDTAAAFDKKNLKAANTSLASLKKSGSDESAIVTEINSYCSGK
ncbi:hypothetical protein H6G80_10045 [Nostoc sp. FACHB-87]|uniref:hypothetical protein n=1 Tax=Nostocales TaxID=1161 RepID=UPI001684D735|nr:MULTISPECIES: hypothetical protein [Nostocales]MBD2298649.1 hypothetical protein [Nostoc sp. FACHB-190]MBD2454419.1 hypothetical protein [Nostoc sp. FACHB-87]MBD2474395.1 hypothetical protein [Anabaena sp. FACHB-83]MBD2487057.1 hypothetical protein [Aulosira sp. FACHB-615]